MWGIIRYGSKSSVIFALGPVSKIKTHPQDAPERIRETLSTKDTAWPQLSWEYLTEMLAPETPGRRGSGELSSRHWTELAPIKQKEVLRCEPGTTKLSMFYGVKGWRTEEAEARRFQNLQRRKASKKSKALVKTRASPN